MNKICINHLIITGSIKNIPFIGKTSLNKEVLSFLLSSELEFKNPLSNKIVKKFTIVNISCWGKIVEDFNDILEKNDFLYIEGHLQSNIWENKNKKINSIVEIIADKIKKLN